jgi:hypothetical protein
MLCRRESVNCALEMASGVSIYMHRAYINGKIEAGALLNIFVFTV